MATLTASAEASLRSLCSLRSPTSTLGGGGATATMATAAAALLGCFRLLERLAAFPDGGESL